jgi:hypothetical protein
VAQPVLAVAREGEHEDAAALLQRAHRGRRRRAALGCVWSWVGVRKRRSVPATGTRVVACGFYRAASPAASAENSTSRRLLLTGRGIARQFNLNHCSSTMLRRAGDNRWRHR